MEMGNGIRNKMLTDWKWSGSKMVVERNVIGPQGTSIVRRKYSSKKTILQTDMSTINQYERQSVCCSFQNKDCQSRNH
jgi:hypothetical protein